MIIFATNVAVGQYTLDNTGGRINNAGTIRVKKGETKAMPDTIGGRVEFLQDGEFGQQAIPNIVFNQLVIKNTSLKLISDAYKDSNNKPRNLTVMDSLILADKADFTSRWIGLTSNDVIARSSVTNSASFSSDKDLVMQNSITSQDLLGNGRFSRLNIDNPNGVNVKGGGFLVSEQLTLSRGELRNSETENFRMGDSSKIIRNVGASLATTAQFEGRVDVDYVGTGSMVSSGELPRSNDNLQRLSQKNNGDLVLTQNVQVNDSLYVAGRIFTQEDTLTIASRKNIEYDLRNPNAEISGSIRLTNLRADSSKMILHNPQTYALFRDELAKNGLNEITVTVRPRTFQPLNLGNTKVRRSIDISGRDANGTNITTGANMTFGYAWRHIEGDSLDENNSLPTGSLVLQRFDNGFWNDVVPIRFAKDSTEVGWAFSFAENVTDFGSFAIGSTGGLLSFNAKVFLEGPYRYGSMADDLKSLGYLEMPPPDVYPYNLDPNRQFYFTPDRVFPDSVVDWVVIEFRESMGERGKYRTALVKRDGRLVDVYGNDVIVLNATGTAGRIDSGEYYVAVRHRNHLAIITQDAYQFYPGQTQSVDFTDYTKVMGGAASMKIIDKDSVGSWVYGMFAGEMNGNIFTSGQSGEIDDKDYNSVIPDVASWSFPLFQGYLLGDINLDGIITTKDFNISFNNRTKRSAVLE